MQSEPMKQKSQNRFETKMLIGLASIAGTIGLWSLFAAKAADEVKPVPQPVDNGKQAAPQQMIEFPPIPTLAAIRTLDPATIPGDSSSGASMTTLRQVSQPTPIQQTIKKPVFEQLTINRPGSSGGGTSARSGSSR